MKSEPEEYSFSDLMRDGRAVWDGVRNPQAQKYLRQMEVGEEVLYYHTGKERAIVGIARVVRTAFPDPTDPRYMAVELEGVRWLERPVPLAEIKADSFFKGFALVRQSRLSVMPVPQQVWQKILEKASS